MDSTTQLLADLTTTAAGGTSVVKFIDNMRPSKNIDKGEKHLQSAVGRLLLLKKQWEKGNIPTKEVRDLNSSYK